MFGHFLSSRETVLAFSCRHQHLCGMFDVLVIRFCFCFSLMISREKSFLPNFGGLGKRIKLDFYTKYVTNFPHVWKKPLWANRLHGKFLLKYGCGVISNSIKDSVNGGEGDLGTKRVQEMKTEFSTSGQVWRGNNKNIIQCEFYVHQALPKTIHCWRSFGR